MLSKLFGSKTAVKTLLYLQRYGEGFGRGISENFDIPQPQVRKQLIKFEAGGFLVTKTYGKTVVYAWNPDDKRVPALRAFLEEMVNQLPPRVKDSYFNTDPTAKRATKVSAGTEQPKKKAAKAAKEREEERDIEEEELEENIDSNSLSNEINNDTNTENEHASMTAAVESSDESRLFTLDSKYSDLAGRDRDAELARIQEQTDALLRRTMNVDEVDTEETQNSSSVSDTLQSDQPFDPNPANRAAPADRNPPRFPSDHFKPSDD